MQKMLYFCAEFNPKEKKENVAELQENGEENDRKQQFGK